eukprot:c14956_g1_i1 orf=964-1296(+)
MLHKSVTLFLLFSGKHFIHFFCNICVEYLGSLLRKDEFLQFFFISVLVNGVGSGLASFKIHDGFYKSTTNDRGSHLICIRGDSFLVEINVNETLPNTTLLRYKLIAIGRD